MRPKLPEYQDQIMTSQENRPICFMNIDANVFSNIYQQIKSNNVEKELHIEEKEVENCMFDLHFILEIYMYLVNNQLEYVSVKLTESSCLLELACFSAPKSVTYLQSKKKDLTFCLFSNINISRQCIFFSIFITHKYNSNAKNCPYTQKLQLSYLLMDKIQIDKNILQISNSYK